MRRKYTIPEEYNLSPKTAKQYRLQKNNQTDLPCVPFEQYCQHRLETIRSLIDWHTRNPGPITGTAENLKRLLDRLPEDLGMNDMTRQTKAAPKSKKGIMACLVQ